MSEAVDLRPLKKWLGRGEIGEIMKEVGIGSRVHAANIIRGQRQNWQFVQAFLERVEKNKALVEKVNSL